MTDRKRIVSKLDVIVSKIVRLRDKHCVICGTTENLTNGHLFSRVNYSTRWNLLNCHCQCAGCNCRHEYDWEPYRKWFVREFGQAEYDELYHIHKQVTHFKTYELEEMYEELKNQLKLMEAK